MKEQVIICTDSQVAVVALGASRTNYLLVADCIKKPTALSNQVTIMWVAGHSGVQKNETTRLEREGARTRPIDPEYFLPLSFSRFKYRIRNWIVKRKRMEWRVCERYGTSQ